MSRNPATCCVAAKVRITHSTLKAKPAIADDLSRVGGALACLAPLERVNVRLLDARILADNFFAMNFDLFTS